MLKYRPPVGREGIVTHPANLLVSWLHLQYAHRSGETSILVPPSSTYRTASNPENQYHLRRATGTGDNSGGGDGGGQEGGVIGIKGVFVACGVIIHNIPLPPIQKVAPSGDPCCPPSPSQRGLSRVMSKDDQSHSY